MGEYVNDPLADSSDGFLEISRTRDGRVVASGLAVTTSPKRFGAKGDGKTVIDANITSGTPTLTSATAGFTKANEGNIVAVIGGGAAAGTLGTTILAFVNSTTVTLAANAATTVTGGTAHWGTDDAVAVQAALDALATVGGTLQPDPGVYMLGSRIIQPAGVHVRGSGLDYCNFGGGAGSLIGAAPTRGTVFRAGGAFNSSNSLWRMGATQVTYTSGNVSPTAAWCMFDGSYLAQSGLQTWAARAFISYSWIGQGTLYGFDMSGQNSRAFGCVSEGGAISGVSTVLMNANDTKYWQGEVRNGGRAQLEVTGACGNFRFTDNDVFGATAAGAVISHGVLIAPTAQTGGDPTCAGVINNNNIDASRGEMLKIAPAAGIHVGSISFCNNRIYGSGSWPNSTFFIVRIDVTAAASSLLGLLVNDNNINVAPGAGTWAGLIARTSGTGTFDDVIACNNVCLGMNQLFASITPTYQAGNSWVKLGATHQSSAKGVATFSGTGAQTAFTIAHSMSESGGAVPTVVDITPRSTDAKGDFYVSAIDDTNITVTYGTAPLSGTNNVVLHWRADL